MLKKVMLSAVAVAAVTTVFAPATVMAQATSVPPVSTYASDPDIDDLALSPDGQMLAFATRVNGKRALLVKDRQGQTLKGFAVGDVKLRSVSWVNKDFLLIRKSTTADLRGYVGPGEFPQSFLIGMDGKTSIQLFSKTLFTDAFYGGWPWIRDVDGETRIYAQKRTIYERGSSGRIANELNRNYVSGPPRNDLYLHPLKDAPATIAKQGSEFTIDWVLDARGEVLAREDYDANREIWKLLVPAASGGMQIIKEGKYGLDRPSLLGQGRTPGTFIVAGPIDGNDPDGLYEVSRDGTFTRITLDEKGRVIGLITKPRDGSAIGYIIQKDTPLRRYFDPAMQASMDGLHKAFSGQIISILDKTTDMNTWLVGAEGKGDSGSYYLFDRATGKVDYLAVKYEALEPEVVGEQTYTHYMAADGLKIPAYVTLPPAARMGTKPMKNLPLIVLPHGGPQARDVHGYDYWAQTLASRGYVVLQPNFRGSDGYGEAFVRAGHGQWGRKMQSDLSDGVRHLAKEGLIDPKRVCIVGASYGGYAAMAGPSLDPGVYRCASAVAGVSDLESMVDWEERQSGGKFSQTVAYWNRFMGPREGWSAVSPLKQIDKITVPIQLIHGKDDTVVPLIQSTQMRDALQKAGKPVEFVELKGEDHYLSKQETRIQMLEAMVKFLETHNPPN
ncbi:MAG: alpha/beta hydrolase family protein [Asticcacaulis sp.]